MHWTPPTISASGFASRMAAAVALTNSPYSVPFGPCFQHQMPSGSFQTSNRETRPR